MGRSSLAVSTLVLVIAAATGLASIADDSFRIIVNPNVKGNQIPKAALTQIFLKQAVKWGDGAAARPVDQSLRSPGPRGVQQPGHRPDDRRACRPTGFAG